MPSPPQSLVGESLAGRWRIIGFIRAGGQGALYRVREENGATPLVAKVLEQGAPRDAVLRLQREGQVGLGLPGHTNLLRVHHYDKDSTLGVHFLIMQELDGDDLRNLMASSRGLSEAVAKRVLLGVARGLEALHTSGFVHRDLKPGNVVLDRRGGPEPIPTIVDFGMARRVDNRTDLTQIGVAKMLTPAWCAPEQFGDTAPVTTTLDVYSWGLLACFLATGRHPFMAGSDPRRRQDLQPRAGLVNLPGYSKAFSRIVNWALSFDPEQRPVDGSQLVTEISNIDRRSAPPSARAPSVSGPPSPSSSPSVVGGGTGAGPTPPRQGRPRPNPRWRKAALFTATLALAVWGGTQWLSYRKPSAPLTIPPGRPVAIAVGAGHICFVDTRAHLFCLGDNRWGQLGQVGLDSSVAPRPVPVPGSGLVNAVWVARDLSCTASNEGRLYCWGRNAPDSARRTPSSRFEPSFVTELGRPLGVTVAESVVCARVPIGSWQCFGGDVERYQSILDQFGNEVRDFQVSEDFACLLDTSDIVWCGGQNRGGRLGTGSSRSVTIAQVDAPEKRFSRLSVGLEHVCARESSRGWMCWGANELGQLGSGHSGGDEVSPVFVQNADGPFQDLRMGRSHTCATREGTLEAYCWGGNAKGELGTGSLARRMSAVPVATDPSRSYEFLAVGPSSTCGITSPQAEFFCWGDVPGRGVFVAPIQLVW